MEYLGAILKAFRTEVLKVSLEKFSAILKEESPLLRISDSTLGGYERKERANQIHGSAELYRVFKKLYGIDLSECLTEKCIVVDDLTKMTPNNVQQLKRLPVRFKNIPVFGKHIPPFNDKEKYPEPLFSVCSELSPKAEFGILVINDSIAPAIHKVDYVFFRELLTDGKVTQEDLYLVSFDSPGGRTFKTGTVEQKKNEIVLVEAKPDPKPVVIPEDMVKGIYKVVGRYSDEAKINQ